MYPGRDNKMCILTCFFSHVSDDRDGWPARLREDHMGQEPRAGEPWKILHPGQRHHRGQDDGQSFCSSAHILLS